MADQPEAAHVRARRTQPVLMALRDVMALPTPELRRAELMERLQVIWDLSQNKAYTNKRGEEIVVPDVNAMLRVVEVADKLMNPEQAGALKGAYNRVDWSMFEGRKAASA